MVIFWFLQYFYIYFQLGIKNQCTVGCYLANKNTHSLKKPLWRWMVFFKKYSLVIFFSECLLADTYLYSLPSTIGRYVSVNKIFVTKTLLADTLVFFCISPMYLHTHSECNWKIHYWYIFYFDRDTRSLSRDIYLY